MSYRPAAPDVALHLERPEGGWEQLCTGLCTLELPIGTHQLALSRFGREPVAVPPVTIRQDIALQGRYRSRKGLRTFGWVMVGLGAAATIYGLVAGVTFAFEEGDLGPLSSLIVGPVFMTVGLLLALVVRDRAYLGGISF